MSTLKDSDKSIWKNWIVDIEVVTPDGKYIYDGTGSLVGANDVLTNAHLLVSNDFSISDATINLYFGGKDSGYASKAVAVEYFDLDEFYGSGYSENLAQYDLGIITLDTNIGEELGWFGLAYGKEFQEDYLNVAGFPGDVYDADTLYFDYIAANYNNYRSYIDYVWPDGYAGSSGSPVWVLNDLDYRYLVGVNTLRYDDGHQNIASLFNAKTFATLAKWIRENDSPSTHTGTASIWDNDSNYWDANIVSDRGLIIAAHEAQLYRIYNGAMGRLPDLDGYQWWIQQMKSGLADLDRVANGFIDSVEFLSYADTNQDKSISNAELVTHMYTNVLGRAPDQKGFEWWMGMLDSQQKTQGGVLLEMTQSNEYVELTLIAVGNFDFIV